MAHGQTEGATPVSIHSFADHWSFGKPLCADISDAWRVRKA